MGNSTSGEVVEQPANGEDVPQMEENLATLVSAHGTRFSPRNNTDPEMTLQCPIHRLRAWVRRCPDKFTVHTEIYLTQVWLCLHHQRCLVLVCTLYMYATHYELLSF